MRVRGTLTVTPVDDLLSALREVCDTVSLEDRGICLVVGDSREYVAYSNGGPDIAVLPSVTHSVCCSSPFAPAFQVMQDLELVERCDAESSPCSSVCTNPPNEADNAECAGTCGC